MTSWLRKNKNKSTQVSLAPPEAPKADRPLEEIQKEYSQFVAELGQKQYHVYCLNEDINLLHRRVRELNLEAAAVKQKEVAAVQPEQKESPDA